MFENTHRVFSNTPCQGSPMGLPQAFPHKLAPPATTNVCACHTNNQKSKNTRHKHKNIKRAVFLSNIKRNKERNNTIKMLTTTTMICRSCLPTTKNNFVPISKLVKIYRPTPQTQERSTVFAVVQFLLTNSCPVKHSTLQKTSSVTSVPSSFPPLPASPAAIQLNSTKEKKTIDICCSARNRKPNHLRSFLHEKYKVKHNQNSISKSRISKHSRGRTKTTSKNIISLQFYRRHPHPSWKGKKRRKVSYNTINQLNGLSFIAHSVSDQRAKINTPRIVITE